MTVSKSGMRPRQGDAVVLIENRKPFDVAVTKSGTKYFYVVRHKWNKLQFVIGGPEGQAQQAWSNNPARVYSSMAAYEESQERGHLLRRLSDVTHNCVYYSEVKNRCPTANIRRAIELLEGTE